MLNNHHPHSFWYQLGFIATQIGIAIWQAAKFTAQQPINHILWAGIVATEIVLIFFISKKNWALALMLILERFIVFTPFLNIIRHKSFFYTNGSGSWLDKNFGHLFEPMFFIAVLLLAFLEWKYNKLLRIRSGHH